MAPRQIFASVYIEWGNIELNIGKQQRKYPYDYELEQKYREFQSQKVYKDDDIENAITSLEKLNQIQTLDHRNDNTSIATPRQVITKGGGGGRNEGRPGRQGGLKKQSNVAPSSSVIEMERKPNGMIGTAHAPLQTEKLLLQTKNKEKSQKFKNDSTDVDDDTELDDELEMMKHGSSEKDSESIKDLSFTLPKPLNLKHAKVHFDHSE